jgi:hypothetical protein
MARRFGQMLLIVSLLRLTRLGGLLADTRLLFTLLRVAWLLSAGLLLA